MLTVIFYGSFVSKAVFLDVQLGQAGHKQDFSQAAKLELLEGRQVFGLP